MDLTFDVLQLAGIAYLVWLGHRKPPKAPQLRDLVRQALQQRARDGSPVAGRERLRARLAAKLAEKQAK